MDWPTRWLSRGRPSELLRSVAHAYPPAVHPLSPGALVPPVRVVPWGVGMTEPKRRFPRIGYPPRELREALNLDRIHSEVAVTWTEGATPEVYCGDNWCTGGCGLAALVMPGFHGGTLKVSGSQVACGMLMQALRVEWTGPRVDVPQEHREDFLGRWYR